MILEYLQEWWTVSLFNGDNTEACSHDDVIKWKHFPRYWPFVREIHRSPVNFPHKGQWRGALMFTLICARMNGWVNNREAGDLRRYLVHYDVIVMISDRPVVLGGRRVATAVRRNSVAAPSCLSPWRWNWANRFSLICNLFDSSCALKNQIKHCFHLPVWLCPIYPI